MSISSNVPSPVSSDAPRPLAPLAPSSTNRPTAASPIHSTNRSLLTHKQWIVPPRPKPGRKPAIDTPPTKRKAQNRAAQRAFRERKASKIGDLEEQMKAMEEDGEREQEELRGQIRKLEKDVENYNQLLISYSNKMKDMENELKNERLVNARIEDMYKDLKTYGAGSTDAVPLPLSTINREKSNSTAQVSDIRPAAETLIGCGNCKLDGQCECMEQALNMSSLDPNTDSAPKRPHSPLSTSPTDSKRLRQGVGQGLKAEEEENEIDFTTKQPSSLLPVSSSSTLITTQTSANTTVEPCGFCTDNTACLCAELASGNPVNQDTERQTVPLLSQSSDMRKYITLATLPNFSFSRSSTTGLNSCANGPGTCIQCQTDPTSTLFCKSLAATRSPTISGRNDSKPADLCKSCDNSTTCCLKSSSTPQYSQPRTQAVTGPTLSCADAFTTLSRHPAFDRASDELGVWLPQLATVPKGMEGKTAFEIEAASVMGVLRFFDRRFGKGAGGG